MNSHQELSLELTSSSANESTWNWDEADEIAFVLQEELNDILPHKMQRRASLKRLLPPIPRPRQRHVPHGLFYPLALAAWVTYPWKTIVRSKN